MVPEKQELLNKSSEYLKLRGFKKRKQTWLQENEDMLLCYNIQTSQWEQSVYYINVGIVLKGIDTPPRIALGKWHVFQRINPANKSCEEILDEAFSWFHRYGDIQTLQQLSAKSYHDNLPVIINAKVMDSLKR